ncbi:MAG: hypothetical protein AAB780_02265 [Patescibacteria group bacterium]
MKKPPIGQVGLVPHRRDGDLVLIFLILRLLPFGPDFSEPIAAFLAV